MTKSAENQDELQLSPSEKIGYNAANRISGSRSSASTVRALASVVLGFEIIVIFLTGLTFFGLKVFNPQYLGLVGGLVLCGMCVLALALMRIRLGIVIGHCVQLLLFAAGFLMPAVFVIAAMFGGLWIYCLVRGSKIDAARNAANLAV